MTLNTRAGFIKTEADALNDREALRLRSQGLSYREIADELGVDTSTAYRRTQRALSAVPVEDVESYRLLELDRLDALQRAIWDKAIDGNLNALDRVLAIMSRRSKLLGLDAPQRREHSLEYFTSDQITAEVKRLEQLLADNEEL
jgi:predicted transcriptional regulator